MLQRLHTKVDTVVCLVADVAARMVKLEDLPKQLQAGLSHISGQISSFRSMVLQVGAWLWVMLLDYDCLHLLCHVLTVTVYIRCVMLLTVYSGFVQ